MSTAVQVQTSITSANQIVISQANLNANLNKNGLPNGTLTILSDTSVSTAPSAPATSTTLNVGLIAGIAVGFVLLLLIAICLKRVCFRKKTSNEPKYSEVEPNPALQATIQLIQPEEKPLLSDEEKQIMQEAALKETPVGQNKFYEPIYKLISGMPVAAANGLEDRLCMQHNLLYARVSKGVEGIQTEIDELVLTYPTNEDAIELKEILHYIRFEEAGTRKRQYANGVMDEGREKMRLSDFCSSPKAKNLSEPEVVAIRLYTTLAYVFMNQPLRDDDRYNSGSPCPLPVITHFAASGIRKLRALQVGKGETVLWRGMRNREIADEFMEKGGTELAFMSTTQDLAVAVRYCLSAKSLIFKVVSTGFMTMGAEVQWISAFPGESEILYPPLTYLKPTGRTETVKIDRDGDQLSFTVVEVQPQLS